MNSKQYSLLVVLVIVFSLAGAVLSSRLCRVSPAAAGKMSMAPEGPPSTGPDLIIRSLTLVDSKGRTRAALRLKADGAPTLIFYDEKGSDSLSLVVTADGEPNLRLLGSGGSKVLLGIGKQGARFLVFGSKGKLRMIYALPLGGDPLIGLQDRNGKARVAVGKVSSDAWVGSQAGHTVGVAAAAGQGRKDHLAGAIGARSVLH